MTAGSEKSPSSHSSRLDQKFIPSSKCKSKTVILLEYQSIVAFMTPKGALTSAAAAAAGALPNRSRITIDETTSFAVGSLLFFPLSPRATIVERVIRWAKWKAWESLCQTWQELFLLQCCVGKQMRLPKALRAVYRQTQVSQHEARRGCSVFWHI